MRPASYLLAILCAALGALVADVEAAKKSTSKGAASTIKLVAAGAAGKAATTSTKKAAASAAVAARGMTFRVTRRTSAAAAATTTAAVTEEPTSTPAPSGTTAAGSLAADDAQDMNLTDASAAKGFPANKPQLKPGAYPFVVSVQKSCGTCGSYARHFCAGALVAPAYVLSLGQCAEVAPGEGPLLVRAGDASMWPPDSRPTQRVSEVMWHDALGAGEDNPRYDAILLKLEAGFQLNEYIAAVALPPVNYRPEGAVTVVGYGMPGLVEHVELHSSKATLRPMEECQRIAPQEVLAASSSLCAQPAEAPQDYNCRYDPSDPVVVEGEQTVLVGLLSRWYLPCSAERPVVAVQIMQLVPWLQEKIPAVPTPGPPGPPGPGTSPATASTVSQWPATPAFPTSPPATTPGSGPGGTGSSYGPVTVSNPTTSTTATPPQATHVKPMTVSSSSASGVMSNTSSTSDAALLLGRMESSLSYSLGTAAVEPNKPALSNSVSVGWANCHGVAGALGMTYSLAYSFVGEGTATSASTVNATCAEVNAVQSQGWSMSSSGLVPLNVRAFVEEHLASIPGLHRQPTLKYL